MGEIIPALAISPGHSSLRRCQRPIDLYAHRGDAGDRSIFDDHDDHQYFHLDNFDDYDNHIAGDDHDDNLHDHDDIARGVSGETQTSVAQSGQCRHCDSRALDCGSVTDTTPATDRQPHEDDDDVGGTATSASHVLATRALLERHRIRSPEVPL